MKTTTFALLVFFFLGNIPAISQNTSSYFQYGVASGDPLHDRVILWTKVEPKVLDNQVNVEWEIARDFEFTQVQNKGKGLAFAEDDFTFKVDVDGLSSNTWYYYRFKFNDEFSEIGRTKTLPLTGETQQVRIAVASCQDYEYGYYNAYHNLVKRNDVDAVVFLGDYIYEYASFEKRYTDEEKKLLRVRANVPEHEIVTLDDYRTRYKTYRSDSNLREAHRQFPWICIWDDHEHANDAWKGGAQNHNPKMEGSWDQRIQNSVKAYYEWMPIRISNPDNLKEIYRNFNFGDLFQLIMLETRIVARDQQLENRLPINDSALNDYNRRLLGKKQLDWLEKKLQENTAQWVVLGQQVMMSPLLINAPMVSPKIGNSDQWDGYPAERQRVYDLIDKYKIKNFVVLTGDIHTAWSSNLPRENYNPSSPKYTTYGVEFVTASITSGNLSNKIPTIHRAVRIANPHFKYVDLYAHGYFVLDVTKERIQCDHIFVDNIKTTNYNEVKGKSYFVNSEEGFLRKAKSQSSKLEKNPALAP